MKNNLLPLGTRDEFGRRASEKQHIISVIADSFSDRGFSKVSTPLLEKQAVFEPYKLGNYQMYRLLDQEGDTIVLRPDMTLPIARFLSSTNIALPQKFWYIGDIFRISRRLSGSYNELTQAGIELVGYSSIKAEFECLVLINQLSQKLLDEPVEIELGIADFTKAVLSTLTDDEDLQDEIAAALYDKQVPKYEQLIQRFSTTDEYQFLLKWPRLFGKPDVIFEQLKDFNLPESIQNRVAELKNVIDWIKQTMPEQALSLDLSSRAPQKYYTGLTFKGFSKAGSGYLFSGGRYDKLLSNFQDVSESAVGMGIDIDLITDLVVSDSKEVNKKLIYFKPEQWQEAEKVLNKTTDAILSLSETREDAEVEAKKLNATIIDMTEGEFIE
ncbi:ATP phosphoribosyltransferase regulatory subunit [Companilactobacillus ginsenosidimutans]|uniref:ATP phosphoribosyltransferase regulatory subunit n=1 Tax=Companilactobacillus ginsenosidimutans TaxID=1007676 RepID=A0A0H4QM12_9LACO|nr:ATP phosphoribosyltransferase regulatory subunit [Companilactobacillus ginsenosidimutans]AKP68151.1 ATP phosphoribosyltransferase [Companilactobacillus ginsenosidimutans]